MRNDHRSLEYKIAAECTNLLVTIMENTAPEEKRALQILRKCHKLVESTQKIYVTKKVRWFIFSHDGIIWRGTEYYIYQNDQEVIMSTKKPDSYLGLQDLLSMRDGLRLRVQEKIHS